MPPFPPKNDVLGCRGVTDPSSEVCRTFEGIPEKKQPRRTYCNCPSEALRCVRTGGKTGNSRYDGGTFLGPRNPASGAFASEYGTGEMTSGLARLPFVPSPLLDERVCPLQERSVMLLNRKNQESPAHAAMKEDTKGAVRWFDFISQYPKVLPHLFFGGHLEAGVVISDDTLSSLDQLANLAPKYVLAGFTPSGPQIEAFDAVIGIEKYEVAPGGCLKSTLEPVGAGTSDPLFPVADALPPIYRAGEQWHPARKSGPWPASTFCRASIDRPVSTTCLSAS